jgi:exodeoxyribonuclease VII large subunit
MVGAVCAVSQEQLAAEIERQAETDAEVQTLANREIIEGRKTLKHLEDMAQAHDPVRILRRGFSITLNARGKAVKSTTDLAVGEVITTRLAAGQICSTVTQTT